MWEDPREVHQVIAEFDGPAPPADRLRLEYWGSRWPQQHLPKDREPGGGNVGWMELGNWHTYGWRVADAEARTDGSKTTFTFHPVNAREFPKLNDYPATFRYTLKLRITSDAPLPKLVKLRVFTDSSLDECAVNLAWKKAPPAKPVVEVFNGELLGSPDLYRLRLKATENPDPNTFDRTLVTVRSGKAVFTFKPDDLAAGPLFIPCFGVAILAGDDTRDYAAIAKAHPEIRNERLSASAPASLYDRVNQMPEQTWRAAWEGMPPKKSRIYLPLALDGGRQKFMLEADGTIRFRANDHFLKTRRGQETPRFGLEAAPVRISLGEFGPPTERSLEESTLPVCHTVWARQGLKISETVLLTELEGTKADSPTPPADAFAVLLARLAFTSTGPAQRLSLPLSYKAGNAIQLLRLDENGDLWLGDNLRVQTRGGLLRATNENEISWIVQLEPGESKSLVVKVPYVPLTTPAERDALTRLDFDTERAAVAGYWRRRLDESARLITPEPVLNDFYRAQASHLLINCEREPNSDRRFARVGSFAYGAYGNESCMMVVDLDRRGYHREAQDCLDAWLHYQGTVKLPGDFASKEGVLYGAGGYEAGGYNQHHGWILWMLAEHYRFTRDQDWLRRAAPGVLAGADWVIRETKRTANRHELERGLLPAGSLEDIGDWWTWLSTSCYTWRGLDSAAWALEQLRHPEAQRVRKEAAAYHSNLLAHFRAAAQRSPVVRLRDGTAVPHFPSQVHRRGRSFGWICETLEGALHLLISGALDARAPEAEWILKDYEDNLFLSNQYGYTLADFDRDWFDRGGMSMQACLLLDVEPYLYRDDVKHALRAMFNAIAVSHFPDVHMNTEHALPNMDDWRGDHFKSSDEANACGWLRHIFVREQGEELLLGQAVPRDWLKPGQRCGLERAATYFGPVSVVYSAGENEIKARIDGPRRNPPKRIRLRFRAPDERPLLSVTVNGKPWKKMRADWVELPGNIGVAEVAARLR